MSTQAAENTGDQNSRPPEPRGSATRWRLHRGGIVNIWQYGEQTFDLDGGRAIFQGANGSGKSRTLELLLPLCLDGDLHHIGSKGFDTVSMRRLMLDEYTGGPNRIGYAWIELRRVSPEGAAEFLTCGVGVKAAGTSRQISDSWRFITDERVPDRHVAGDLKLVGPGDVPPGAAQLREILGADCVLDEQAFRARIAATVYGVPTERYGDLLHLQRTLRNPDVGLKVLGGRLEQILSDALPPLDAGLIERLATSFDDLESVRENIIRLTGADSALETFLSTYSDYALTALRSRANAMRAAGDRLRARHEDIAVLERRRAETQQDRATAEHTVSELEKRAAELESGLDALRSHPAYTELQNLRDRQRLVDNIRSAAVDALETARTHREQEERSVDSVVGWMRRLLDDVDLAEQTAGQAAQHLTAAGLDGSLVPRPPAVPAAEATARQDRVRAAPEADAEPLTIDRRAPPRLDVEDLTAAFHDAAARAHQAATAAQQRGAQTLALHQQAAELDTQRTEVAETQRLAKQARVTATEAMGRRNQARQELSEIAGGWLEHVRAWASGYPLSGVADPLPEPPTLEQLLDQRSAARQARERVRDWARPQLHRARRVETEIGQELADLRSRGHTLDEDLAELRAGGERAPARPGWATAERSAAEGSAFHRLVDFTTALSEEDRAGLEAALEASGLLNAWVTADGTVTTPGVRELFAAPGEQHGTRSLTDLLVPAPEPGCPVSRERIAALLASVPVDTPGGLSVSPAGEWQAGVLSGAWHKDAAEYVGAGAREAGRKRRIAELEAELSRLRAEIGEAERRHREAADHATELERYVDSFPDDGDLLGAHARLSTATEIAQEAEREATRLLREHEQAEQRWQAAYAELVRATGEIDLPAETEALAAAHHASSEARSSLERLREVIERRCLATLADLRQASLHHDAAIADRMAAESQAEQRCTDHGEQASALAELRAAVGGEGQEVADKIGSLERERTDLDTQLPQKREEVVGLRIDESTLDTRLEDSRSRLAECESEAGTTAEDFRQALRIPGLWAATRVRTADPDNPPADPDEAAELVTAEERPPVTETDVYNELPSLQHALSGTDDITAQDRNGLLTVTVTGEEGGQPVAEAARRVRERLAEQRGYLDERYQSIFADYLIRDLAERLRSQIAIAEDLCERMNAVLDGARSSQGVHVQLEWQPAAGLSDDLRHAVDLLRTPFANRSDEQDALLRRVFTDLIDSERDSASGGYHEILSRALDYRSWYTFTVRVRDTGPEGKPRMRRLQQLSSGESRLVSYVTLFAAAAAFYDAIDVSSGAQGPLRLVLLDEAFERLDDPTVARMLGLLVDLDMDWVITWPSGWGVSPKIPKMHIYDVLRPSSGHGIACTHTTWDGRGLDQGEP
ncbi:TIGR02680 family protein [Haloactinomyces albus]|uniref:Uncharacterized protein (TIGR02680 family) n=1 Tax=Haloactinomyces albus TaxID=1352928 RepID=A0AAE4CK62_9ACTN|nr:TIGR02680 family protein [Haloactinomyces albus]MDR7300835.1 uncharacterized protein (TIGR02680 family) [Haloactinomyces albus]